MDKYNRSVRIHHRNRIKNKVRKYMTIRNGRYQSSSEGIDPRLLGINSNTKAICSCVMCGNSRKYFGEITIQEKRHLDIYNSYYYDDKSVF